MDSVIAWFNGLIECVRRLYFYFEDVFDAKSLKYRIFRPIILFACVKIYPEYKDK